MRTLRDKVRECMAKAKAKLTEIRDAVDADNHGEEGEEMSALQVQQMLEQMDAEDGGVVVAAPPPAPAVVSAPGDPHALDDAPVNSKIVVTDEGAMLATPSGVSVLPKSDRASRLPVGARIVKAGPVLYIASQLSATVFVEPKNYPSAAAAIADFQNHFHSR